MSSTAVLLRKISSFGDPRLYALQEVAEKLSHSQQPLVPDRLFVSGSQNGESSPLASGILGTLLELLVAEKTGWTTSDHPELDSLRQFSDQVSKNALASMSLTLSELKNN